MRMQEIGAIASIDRIEIHKQQNAPVPSFKDTMASFLTDVNYSQKSASDAQLKLLSGEATDVHQVMIKSEEAKISFNMLMELKTKSMDGLQDLMRTKL